MHFCTTMKKLYDCNPYLPLGIALGGIGGTVACAFGAATGSVALATFGAYAAVGATLESLGAMKNPAAFENLTNLKQGKGLPSRMTLDACCAAVPLLTPPIFLVSHCKSQRRETPEVKTSKAPRTSRTHSNSSLRSLEGDKINLDSLELRENSRVERS